MTHDEEAEAWTWPLYNPPGLLVGPVPYVRSPSGGWVPDYRHPGVRLRIAVEVSFIVDQEKRT
jgi:hypothetical protein